MLVSLAEVPPGPPTIVPLVTLVVVPRPIMVSKRCYWFRARVDDYDDEYRNGDEDDDGNDDGYVDKHCGVGGGA